MAKKKKQKPDAAEKGVEGEETVKKSGGLIPKLSMLIALGAASFGTVFLLPRADPAPAVSDHRDAGDHADAEEVLDFTQETTFLELTPLTISLQEDMRILKIGITLETLYGEETAIDPNDPKIRDAFMGYLRALRLDQIQDAAFMAQMRAQLLRRAQLVHGTDKVRGILITDFLVR